MRRIVLSKERVKEIAIDYGNNPTPETLKKHGLSRTTLWRKMKEYGLKREVTVRVR